MNTFTDSEILKNALVGVEFEFFSDLGTEETAKQLEKVLNKKIRVETKAHSDFEVTSKEFKICKFILHPLHYLLKKIRLIINKFFYRRSFD